MKRGVKIGIICGTIGIILLCIGIYVYFNFFKKETYEIVGIEKTTYKVADFTKNSELKFYDNHTFHIRIEHKDVGLCFTGIGTYTLEGKTYNLEFVQAFGRDTENQIVDIMPMMDDDDNYIIDKITCTRSGNRIKFIDHKSQIFYFG